MRTFLTMVVVGIIALGAGLAPTPSAASSHRDAPLISKDPFADNTDTYAFISPSSPNHIVLAASWIPFEGPEAGPNYWEWDDNVRYDINVDTNGDAKADVVYTLSSKVEVRNPNTFQYNTGPITSLSDPDWNQRQRYTVTETVAGRPRRVIVDKALVPPSNIGSKSTPNYEALVNKAIYTYTDPANGDKIKIFAGQTDDAFYADQQIFDLLTLRGQNPPIGYQEGNNRPVDSFSGFNVHSLVLEIPISRLVVASDPVLGVWATARRPSTRVLQGGRQITRGREVQVSRLGLPLVNQMILPLALKDAFNGLEPQQDFDLYTSATPAGVLFRRSFLNPEVASLLCSRYSIPLPKDGDHNCHTDIVNSTGRGDIVAIFLTGMKTTKQFTINTPSGAIELPAGVNINQPDNVRPAEMIRINVAMPFRPGVTGSLCSPVPNYRLGLLGGDICGFPNGRRLADDVVDIELLIMAGAVYPVLDGTDTTFAFNPALINTLTDRVNTNDVAFRQTFPYLAIAQSGQDHFHQNQSGPLTGSFEGSILAMGGAVIGMIAWRRRRRVQSLTKP
jgi:hypothetical protein